MINFLFNQIVENISMSGNLKPYEVKESIKVATCPKITLNGWWWKKYIPYYQRKSNAMNDIMLKSWIEKGYDEWVAKWGEIMDQGASQILINAMSANYIQQGDSIKIKE